MSIAELRNYLKEVIETWNINRPTLKEVHTTFENFKMADISKWPAFLDLSYGCGDINQTLHKDRSSSKGVHLSFLNSKWPPFQNGHRFFKIII